MLKEKFSDEVEQKLLERYISMKYFEEIISISSKSQ